jgi:hypothetical protein
MGVFSADGVWLGGVCNSGDGDEVSGEWFLPPVD